jgi:hypothetical protein
MSKIKQTDRSTPGCAGAVLWFAIVFFAALLLLSCKTSSHITTDTTETSTETTFDSAQYHKKENEKLLLALSWAEKKLDINADFTMTNDSLLSSVIYKLQDDKELTEAERDSLAEKLKEAQQNCSTGGGTAKVKPDGSFELTGLRSLSASMLEKISNVVLTEELYKEEKAERIASQKREQHLQERIDILQKTKTGVSGWFYFFSGIAVGIMLVLLFGGKVKRLFAWIRS